MYEWFDRYYNYVLFDVLLIACSGMREKCTFLQPGEINGCLREYCLLNLKKKIGQ